LHDELDALRIDSPFVFAVYRDQLRKMHADNLNWLRKIDDHYSATRFGRWFYDRIKDWSATNPKGSAFVHIFRKTMMQHSRRGEDINRQIAKDARVTEGVMMTSYVKEADEEMRQRSNRTYFRILASLSPEVARRYGHVEDARSELERRLRAAIEAKDWGLSEELASKLGRPEAG
jgi:hypothetical protein